MAEPLQQKFGHFFQLNRFGRLISTYIPSISYIHSSVFPKALNKRYI